MKLRLLVLAGLVVIAIPAFGLWSQANRPAEAQAAMVTGLPPTALSQPAPASTGAARGARAAIWPIP